MLDYSSLPSARFPRLLQQVVETNLSFMDIESIRSSIPRVTLRASREGGFCIAGGLGQAVLH